MRLPIGWSVRRGVMVFVAAALVVSACGSDDSSSGRSGAQENSVDWTNAVVGEGSAPVAGALENVVATGDERRDWPSGATVVPCAVDAIGPGGGRVFFDAGSVQSWGRFLEVAPQN